MSLENLRKTYVYPTIKPSVEGNKHGWFNKCNEDVLSLFLNENTKLIIELGSWLGKSTRFLANKALNANIIAIDHWKGSNEHQKSDIIPVLYETFIVNCWKYRDRIIPIRDNTINGLKTIHKENLTPDLIYIDASHDYKSVCDDITTSIRLFPKARIVGDDWLWGKHKPVKKAVVDCAKLLNLEIKTIENAWYYI